MTRIDGNNGPTDIGGSNGVGSDYAPPRRQPGGPSDIVTTSHDDRGDPWSRFRNDVNDVISSADMKRELEAAGLQEQWVVELAKFKIENNKQAYDNLLDQIASQTSRTVGDIDAIVNKIVEAAKHQRLMGETTALTKMGGEIAGAGISMKGSDRALALGRATGGTGQATAELENALMGVKQADLEADKAKLEGIKMMDDNNTQATQAQAQKAADDLKKSSEDPNEQFATIERGRQAFFRA